MATEEQTDYEVTQTDMEDPEDYEVPQADIEDPEAIYANPHATINNRSVNDREPVLPDRLDIDNRDPTKMNDFVKVSWDEIFAEPKDVHSVPCVWTNSYKCYKGSKFCCYRLCTFLCGIPVAFCWGITFALLTFCHIWYVVPCLKAYMIELVCVSKVWAVCIQTFFDPCYESLALVFSRIKINVLKGVRGRRNSYDRQNPPIPTVYSQRR